MAETSDDHQAADTYRSPEVRLHAEALCRCLWADHPDEADYHRRELDRLEHEQ